MTKERESKKNIDRNRDRADTGTERVRDTERKKESQRETDRERHESG